VVVVMMMICFFVCFFVPLPRPGEVDTCSRAATNGVRLFDLI
jgi:hypothetical protein